jgi:hypothetical protein
MKSNKLKITLASLLVLILAIGGLFFYASSKLQPEEIKKIALEQTQKVFPKALVQIEKVEIGWGLNFKINLEKFSIDAQKDNQKIEMMSVDHLVVKVPVWAVLTGSGLIEIKLDAPHMNYQEFPEGNNWTYAMGDKKSDSSPKAEDSSNESKSVSSLGFFGKSKIDIKLSDISVKYGLKDNSKGDIKVSRFVVKGLNFESSTAFEIASNAKFVMKDNSVVSFDTIAIGELNIADLVKNGSVSSVVIIKMNNMTKTGLDWKFPEVTTKVDFVLKKEGVLTGNVLTSFESQNKISAKIELGKKVEISDINVEIVLKDVAAIMGIEKMMDFSKAKLTAKGSLVYGEDKKINAQMNFAITPGMIYSKDGLSASTTISGEFKGREINVKAKTETMDGVVNSAVIGSYDPNEKFDMTKLKPFDIKITASGMKLPEKFIRAKMWDKKKEEAPISNAAKNDVSSGQNATPMALPPSNIVLDWSNINIGGEDFSGRGRIVTSAKSMAVDNLNFKFSKGSGKLTQTMTLNPTSSESKFNFEITNLNLSSFKAFLPPFVENFSGTFTGKVNGSAIIHKTEKMPNFDVTVVADASKGEIKKLNLSDYINPMLANIPVVKDQVKDKQVKLDGNFETLSLKGHFTNNLYTLTSFDFVGLDKKVQVTGSGEIYPVAGAKQSSVDVNVIDNTGKISEVLQKNTGSKILPMRVAGPGFEMKPDYNYTIAKLAKGTIKTKGEEKIKEVVQKNIDKIVPEAAKEKVKGILNGLFKK